MKERAMQLDESNQKRYGIADLKTHLRTPLFRNGYALALSSGLASGLGILYWVLAARYYPARVVGLNSAALSVMMFLSGISMLSFNNVLVRFIPTAGQATRRLTSYAYVMSIGMTAITCLVFYASLRWWSPTLQAFFTDRRMLIVFTCATATWCIFSLQDSVLTGLRRTEWVPVENALFAITKIVLLIVFASILHEYGIIASWAVPVVIALIPINAMIFSRFIPQHIEKTRAIIPCTPRQIIKYGTGNYFASLFSLATTSLLPIIIVNQLGAKANAYFYLPWMITYSLQLVAMNMTTSLTVEGALDTDKLYSYCYHILKNLLRILMPIVGGILLFANYMLTIFGTDYAVEGAQLFRLLALAVIPNIIIVLYISIERVQERILGIILLQSFVCITVLGLSYLLLPTWGIIGAGYAWLVVQTSAAIVLLLFRIHSVLMLGHAASQHEHPRS